ncbi:hypothetical protein [Peptoniphilus harei]|uniref:Uncharacterized protein n=1 Tax=Peptoniphilus harei TaxID=54005 RepID=A0A943SS26_9FIRM|nr:hypothetical protein [Peptoniphilus harei]MBS6535752.1 hypothetical protein [Peptoniphilus harei]
MSKKEIRIKIFLTVIALVGAMFLVRYIYINNHVEYRDLSEKPKQEETNKTQEESSVFSKALPKSEEEILEDSRTSKTNEGAEKPKEIVEKNETDNISLNGTEESNNNEINQKNTKDNLIIVPVRSTSSDGRIYVEHNNNIYEVSGISEKYLPIRKIPKENIDSYPVVYFDETKDIYFIYTNISEIKFLKINEKYLDQTTKTYTGKVEEFIL